MSPSDAAWQQLISALHASGRKAALAITGGGSGAISELLRVPGGSRLLIEAQVPYDAQALATFLGFAPSQASSTDTAIAMARSARTRAARLVPADTDLVGLVRRNIEKKQRDQPPVAPDIAVEVWSPTNDRAFLDRKIAKCLATGSLLVLDVDPRARTIVAHAADGVRTFDHGERFEHAAVPWLAFDVAEAFKGLGLLD